MKSPAEVWNLAGLGPPFDPGGVRRQRYGSGIGRDKVVLHAALDFVRLLTELDLPEQGTLTGNEPAQWRSPCGKVRQFKT